MGQNGPPKQKQLSQRIFARLSQSRIANGAELISLMVSSPGSRFALLHSGKAEKKLQGALWHIRGYSEAGNALGGFYPSRHLGVLQTLLRNSKASGESKRLNSLAHSHRASTRLRISRDKPGSSCVTQRPPLRSPLLRPMKVVNLTRFRINCR